MADEINKTIDTEPLVEKLFGIDLRGLAFFRICLALLVIADLLFRLTELKPIHSDEGLLPRIFYISDYMNRWHISFHLACGATEFQGFLLVVHIFFALMLLIGFKTKLFCFLTWLFTTSLHARTEFIIDGADQWVRLMVMYSIFLPLGARYSVDSALDDQNQSSNIKKVTSPATFLLMLQYVIVYVVTAAIKWHNHTWESGNGVYAALSQSQYVSQLGEVLLAKTSMEQLHFLNYFVLCFEFFGALFLMFCPVFITQVRIILVLGFIFMHINFGTFLFLQYFPFAGSAATIPFIPSIVWDKLQNAFLSSRQSIKLYFNENDESNKKILYLLKTFLILPVSDIISASSCPEVFSSMQAKNSSLAVEINGNCFYQYEAFKIICKSSPILSPLSFIFELSIIQAFVQLFYNTLHKSKLFNSCFYFQPNVLSINVFEKLFCIFTAIYITAFNMEVIGFERRIVTVSQGLKNVGFALNLNQWWHMFARYEKFHMDASLWYVFPATLKDGSQVDLFNHGRSVTWKEPEYVASCYRIRYWAKYLLGMRTNPKLHLNYLGKYYCEKWNKEHPPQKHIDHIDFHFVEQRTLEDHKKADPYIYLVQKYYCN